MRAALRLVLPLVAVLTSTSALAGPDLVTTIDAPTGVSVYENARWFVAVDNVGDRHARDVALTIDLPATHTSPVVEVLGVLGAIDADCSASGLQIQCDLGRIRAGRSAEVYFNIELPYAVLDIDVAATASTAGSADTDVVTAALLTESVLWSAPAPQTIEHCTGTDLQSFFECELYPSSITSHTHTLNADGSIALPPGYTGAWWSTGADHLAFEYAYAGDVVMSFEGAGVSADCWEGQATFPGSSYVSMYRVCND